MTLNCLEKKSITIQLTNSKKKTLEVFSSPSSHSRRKGTTYQRTFARNPQRGTGGKQVTIVHNRDGIGLEEGELFQDHFVVSPSLRKMAPKFNISDNLLIPSNNLKFVHPMIGKLFSNKVIPKLLLADRLKTS